MNERREILIREMFKIPKDFALEVIDYLVEQDEFEEREFRFVEWDGCGFAVGTENSDFYNPYSILYVPKNMANDGEYEQISHKFFLDYFKNYGLDWRRIKYKYDMNFYQIYTMIGILHEMGHVIDGDKQIEKYGWLKRLYNDKTTKYCKTSLMTFEESLKYYRTIPCEERADKLAIELFNRHEEEMIKRFKQLEIEYEAVNL